jgi:carboxylate-amine ligase
MGASWGVELLTEEALHGSNDARWLREKHAREQLLAEVVRQGSIRFRGHA